jgi:hypothetical protein
VFYALNSPELFLVVVAVIGGAAVSGAVAGHYLRRRTETYREPVGVLQGALLGVVGLILAFGLTLAVGRYQDRRLDVVADANTIGTAYLRAQTLHEPQRSASLPLFKRYNDLAILVTHEVPGTAALHATSAQEGRVQRQLWRLAGQSLNAHPQDSAPRLYVESLNEMIDQQGVRVAGLNNRVPNAVLALQLFGAALGIGLLALYLGMLGKGLITVAAAAVAVSVLVTVTFDLDRPTRGLITVPDNPLVVERASMDLPPAAPAPG